jgi:hypothetical protein
VAFVPASSLLSGTITVAGTVAVSNFPAVQTVDGTVTVNQGTSPWLVDGSAVTQPVSVSELPLPDGAADNETLSEVALTAILQREALVTQ